MWTRLRKGRRKRNFEVVDLTQIFDSTHEWVFTDWCHVTNGANFVMAKALFNDVKQKIFGLPLTESNRLQSPPDSYFADYSKDAKVLVSGKARDDGLSILKGYPGPRGLEIPGGKDAAVILDLEKSVPISRLRIVWGNEKTVPKSWKIDFSEDGQNWKNWFTEEKTKTDPYDQWPGFEHYSANETNARYVRYSQDPSLGQIYLRQLSLFR